MKKTLITCALVALGVASSSAITPLWLRNAKISPDGSQIAFTYKGDIYKVAATGGQAVRLTAQPSYETNPVWSPDGKQIAFASDRKGNFDVFVMPADGGSAVQLTFNSTSETPWAFSPDGKSVYYSAAIQDPASSAMFPTARLTEVYSVPVAGGSPTQVIATPAEEINFDPQGRFFLYQDQKGMEDALRKHHTSSVTRDVWRYDIATGHHTNLTNRAGEDRSPVLSPDGKNVYILSERNGGSFNVWSFPLDNPAQAKVVTNFTKNPVRFLSVASNSTLCFTYDGEIYTKKNGASPAKVKIDLVSDDSEQIANLKLTRGATSAAASPDGKQVAFIVRGDVFVTSVEYGTTKRITTTPATETSVSWGPDNRTLTYDTQRNGKWEVVKATIERKEDLDFPNATLIKEEIILSGDKAERYFPKISPDGKEIAYIKDRDKLTVYNFASKKERQITDGSQWYVTEGKFNYNWSPDGKWFTLEFIGHGRDPYSDIGIVSAKGGSPVTNITNSAYINVNPRWVMKGDAIMFTSNRYGLRSQASWGSQDDIFLAFVNQEAYDKYQLSKEDYEYQQEEEKAKKAEEDKKQAADADKKKKDDKKKDDGKKADDAKKKDITVELDKIADRIVRVTPNSSDLASAIITDDGNSLYYLSAFENKYDLWKLDLRKHDTKLINKMNTAAADLELDKDNKNLFVLGSNSMGKVSVSADKFSPISYRAEMKLDLAKEREAMFNYVHQEVSKKFYNPNMHGLDWEACVATYRKFLPHINNNYDFANLLSEELGELNASHTGGRYYPDGGEATSYLGLFFDLNFKGKGLKVAEVVANGPFDKAKSQVKAGTIIEKINGTPITVENDCSLLLNGQTGKKTLVSLYNPTSGKRWDEVIRPISRSTNNALLYKRWVKGREALVDSLSHGRLGYVHLQSMNDASYREAYNQVLGKFYKKDGIVIDTRWNGGGRLHEDIEILFSGKKYFTQVTRGKEACDMPSRRWNKPSIMVQCEANYSNAHGTPWVYKHTGIGKLVGMPVPGTMTSVNWVTLQDPSLIFGIPVIGYRLPEGNYLENTQLEPDIKVANNPETVVKGKDEQIEAAVKELLKEIDAKK